MRPVIGILGNFTLVNEHYPTHSAATMVSEAIVEVSDGLPLMIPADPRYGSTEEWMAACDGFLLPGGRPNVHPEEYGQRWRGAAAHSRLRGGGPADFGDLSGISGV